MTAPSHPAPDPRPTWALVAGLAVGTMTLLFLMAFPLIIVLTGKRIECGDAFWVTLIFALAVGLSSAFLGGYAAATGDVVVPLLGNHPLTVAITGGIASVAVGAGIAYFVVNQGCANPELARLQFTKWDYKPTDGMLSFRLGEDEIKLRNFLPAHEAGQYEAWVAVRRRGATPPAGGTYPILLGPYMWGATRDLHKKLTPEEMAALDAGCAVDFLVFGLRKGSNRQYELSAPFKPSDHPNARLFHLAGITKANCQ